MKVIAKAAISTNERTTYFAMYSLIQKLTFLTPFALIKKYQKSIALLLLILFSPIHAYSEDSVTLNLKDADINTLITTISEFTGKNFVIDPRVKGKVTVISKHPMEKKEIYEVFLSILEVHGFTAVPAGEVIKIVPAVKAKQGSIPTLTDNQHMLSDQMVTQVVQVENVAAAQLVPILRPLIPQQGHLAAY
ncbi:MAG: hypothetical protein KAR30_09285, partial [Gammaproteobacteria bacterium]|nr:hypothetical protein [Gammaproteobacteria bacterium]